MSRGVSILSTVAGSIMSFIRWGLRLKASLDEVLGVLRACVEELAKDNNRVTCSAKLDYRKGAGGRLAAKTASVEQKLGKRLKS